MGLIFALLRRLTTTQTDSKAKRLASVCDLLASDQLGPAATLLRTQCRNEATVAVPAGGRAQKDWPGGRIERKYTDVQKTRMFLRDGFVDRYSGELLVFPGVLRLISHYFPPEFPYDPHWKYGVGHIWYWEIYPTVDHLDSAGDAAEDNWVTTSMMRNLKKSNGPLADHGWRLRPIKPTDVWDGLLRWYLQFIADRPELMRVPALKQWYMAGIAAISG